MTGNGHLSWESAKQKLVSPTGAEHACSAERPGILKVNGKLLSQELLDRNFTNHPPSDETQTYLLTDKVTKRKLTPTRHPLCALIQNYFPKKACGERCLVIVWRGQGQNKTPLKKDPLALQQNYCRPAPKKSETSITDKEAAIQTSKTKVHASLPTLSLLVLTDILLLLVLSGRRVGANLALLLWSIFTVYLRVLYLLNIYKYKRFYLQVEDHRRTPAHFRQACWKYRPLEDPCLPPRARPGSSLERSRKIRVGVWAWPSWTLSWAARAWQAPPPLSRHADGRQFSKKVSQTLRFPEVPSWQDPNGRNAFLPPSLLWVPLCNKKNVTWLFCSFLLRKACFPPWYEYFRGATTVRVELNE